MKRVIRESRKSVGVAAAFILAAAAACNKSSSDDGFTPAAPSAVLPAAVAGDDFEAVTNAVTVTLNGSKSVDPAGGPLTFSWTQTAGTAVVLSDPAVASPTFTAPAAEEILTFQLMVTGAEGTDIDTVNVSVKGMVVTAPDTWFAGYEKTGPIAATVSGGTGPYTFEWLGIPAWLNVSGAATPTLTFTTPKLADLQNFPDVTGVALLKRSTQGRVQLTVRVTDDLGAVDEDLVNFSVGPFADTMANENVALGEPAFMNGAATAGVNPITSWTWTGFKPTGAAISFFKPDKTALGAATDQRFVYFVPDLPGPYQVILTQNPGSVVKVIDITSGKYVGVGNLTGTPPDPFKGECASCHAGQFPWLASFATTWKDTRHAKVFESLLDPADPHHAASQAKETWQDAFDFGSEFSIDSRTIGFSRITSGTAPNDGFAQMAAADGFVFKGATWADLVRKHPKTAAKANVQCESCHGPGSEHAGDTAGIRKSYDATLCGRCHSSTHDLWEASQHGQPPISSPSGNASCNGCHTAQGFVVEMRAQDTADPHPVLFATSNVNRPVIPADDRRHVTCQACHDPHKTTTNRPAASNEPQLRSYGTVQFRNGATSFAGDAALCYMCHQSRRDMTAGSSDMNGRSAPHDSTAAEMLAGTNARQFSGWTYSVSPHAIPSKFLKTGQTQVRQCLSCHKDAQPAEGAVGFGALGGHSFRMTQGTGATIAGDSTHSGAVTVAGTAKFTVTSGPTFLRSVFPGDTLTITVGADTGTFTVASIDGARQLRLSGASFAGGAATTWTVTSILKYNTAACTQCHATALDFQMAARADYDGDSTIESVQDEIDGLRTALTAAINARLVTLIGAGTTLSTSSSVRYNKLGSGTNRTFPGPTVTTSNQPDIAWSSLTAAQQAEWETLYSAAYNIEFVTRDRSEGIHNTGYAVNLLQSSYQAVTGTTIGTTFVPFP